MTGRLAATNGDELGDLGRIEAPRIDSPVGAEHAINGAIINAHEHDALVAAGR